MNGFPPVSGKQPSNIPPLRNVEDKSKALAKILDYHNAEVKFRDGKYYITGDPAMTEANVLNAAREAGLVVNYDSVKEDKATGGFILTPNKGGPSEIGGPSKKAGPSEI